MSQTPLTDAFDKKAREEYENYRECGWPPYDVCDYEEFARNLELENTDLRMALYRIATTPLRDYFAAAALQGLLGDKSNWEMSPVYAAMKSYKFADAMLSERNQPIHQPAKP